MFRLKEVMLHLNNSTCTLHLKEEGILLSISEANSIGVTANPTEVVLEEILTEEYLLFKTTLITV
jgi:fibrillarin-like rRNA methylase